MNIKEYHVILDQSQRRISYVDSCKNTNYLYYIKTKKFKKNITFDSFNNACSFPGPTTPWLTT